MSSQKMVALHKRGKQKQVKGSISIDRFSMEVSHNIKDSCCVQMEPLNFIIVSECIEISN